VSGIVGQFVLWLIPLSNGTTDFSVLPSQLRDKVKTMTTRVPIMEYLLPANTTITSLTSLKTVLLEMQKKAVIAENFMKTLDSALKSVPSLKKAMQELNLLHLGSWNDANMISERAWTLDTVHHALVVLEKYEMGQSNVCNTSTLVNKLKDLAASVPLPSRDTLDESTMRQVHPKYHQIVGIQLHVLTLKEYLKLCPTFPRPRIAPHDVNYLVKVLPYIYQELRIVGNVMTAVFFRSIVDETRATPSARVSSSSRGARGGRTQHSIQHTTIHPGLPPVSSLDAMVCLLGTAEWNVRQDLLKKLSCFPLALPLIMPSLFSEGIICCVCFFIISY
jgi:hypothetical protein